MHNDQVEIKILLLSSLLFCTYQRQESLCTYHCTHTAAHISMRTNHWAYIVVNISEAGITVHISLDTSLPKYHCSHTIAHISLRTYHGSQSTVLIVIPLHTYHYARITAHISLRTYHCTHITARLPLRMSYSRFNQPPHCPPSQNAVRPLSTPTSTVALLHDSVLVRPLQSDLWVVDP